MQRMISLSVLTVLTIGSMLGAATVKIPLSQVTGLFMAGQSYTIPLDLQATFSQIDQVKLRIAGKLVPGVQTDTYGVYTTSSSVAGELVSGTLNFTFDSDETTLWGVELAGERFNTSVTFEGRTEATWDFLLDGQADLTCTIEGDFNFPATACIFEAYLIVEGTLIDQTVKDNPFPIPGDANHDNVVNVSDLSILAANYGLEDAVITTEYYDLNHDGAINVSDLGLFGANWNRSTWLDLFGAVTFEMGDFNYDGKINVSDLSILAANYNSGSASNLSWEAACAQAFGSAADDQEVSASADDSSDVADDAGEMTCSSLGLSLVAALAMFGLMMGWNGRR